MAGVACGIHPKYTSCAVLVWAHHITEGTGKEAIHLKTEYEKSGFDQFGVDNQMFNFGDMQKNLETDMGIDKRNWPEGAVSLRTVKEIVDDDSSGQHKTIMKYIYTMGDGQLKIVTEDIEGKVENDNDDVAHDDQYTK